jgi:transcription elongation factor GreA
MADLPQGIAVRIEALKREIEALEREAREEIPAEMESAQAVGPVRENADMYLVAGRAHFVQGRLLGLKQRLKALASLDAASIPRDRAGYGSILEIRDLDTGKRRKIRLASPEEVAGEEDVCSLLSPMGKALRDKRMGDEVEVSAPGGLRFYRVEDLRTIFDQADEAPPSEISEEVEP